MDLMIADESPSEISDAIKNVLYAKTAERIEYARPYVADAMFGLTDDEEEYDDAEENEYDENSGEIDDYVTDEDE